MSYRPRGYCVYNSWLSRRQGNVGSYHGKCYKVPLGRTLLGFKAKVCIFLMTGDQDTKLLCTLLKWHTCIMCAYHQRRCNMSYRPRGYCVYSSWLSRRQGNVELYHGKCYKVPLGRTLWGFKVKVCIFLMTGGRKTQSYCVPYSSGIHVYMQCWSKSGLH